jgi:septal ring factor EnvC (AmiA/AmiB activator)
MFNIFKKIKQLEMTKQQLEEELSSFRSSLGRANTANKDLNNIIIGMRGDLERASARIKYLEDQVKMNTSQTQATARFNDNDRNY